MISRRGFMKIGASSLAAPWFLKTSYASSMNISEAESLSIAYLVAGNPDTKIHYKAAFEAGLTRALSSIEHDPIRFSTLQELGSHNIGGIPDYQRKMHTNVVVGLVPASQWRHTLIELTKHSMNVVLYGQHRHENSSGEPSHEHQFVSAVCDSLGAQLLSGALTKDNASGDRWAVQSVCPTSGRSLSEVCGDNLSNKLQVRGISQPRYAYNCSSSPDSATHERFICSWGDADAIHRYDARILAKSPIKQSDLNRLYALQVDDLDGLNSVYAAGKYGWMACLGFTLGVETLRALKKESLRKVAALPWAPGIQNTLASSNMRTDIFCGGHGNHDKHSCSMGRLELRSFVAVRYKEQSDGSIV